VVSWTKPERPDWMDSDTYAAIPDQLTVREIRFAVGVPGYRTHEVIIATTLTDGELYSAEALADLYHERWHVELDIRSIKISLRMEHLRCQTPFMLEKEIWVHLLAYNLIRKVSAQTAQARGIHPREVSFVGTRDAIAAAWSNWTMLATAAERLRKGLALLSVLGTEKVGQRRGRCEPRLKKRRPKPYKHLREPRAEMQAKLTDT
jgi:hypothetical protein